MTKETYAPVILGGEGDSLKIVSLRVVVASDKQRDCKVSHHMTVCTSSITPRFTVAVTTLGMST
jgi:hypothetical protein